jgi:hypothetical protein
LKAEKLIAGIGLTAFGLIFALLGIGEEGVTFGAATPIVAGQEYIAAGMMVTGVALITEGTK